MYVDSHCHLQLIDYAKLGMDMSEIVNNALSNNVVSMLCVATHLDQTAELQTIADKFVNVKISIGLHPNEEINIEPTVEDFLKAQQHPGVIAIGETGLDYYRNSIDVTVQKQRFVNQIITAKQTNKPLIVHTRNARQDTLEILRAEQADTVGGVLHCFTEDLDTALQAIDLNFYISFSGIVTFKNAKDLQEVARKLPLDRILIETDSPWLTPDPFRGHTNQPANVRYVAEFIAQLHGVDVGVVAKQTTANYRQLFL